MTRTSRRSVELHRQDIYCRKWLGSYTSALQLQTVSAFSPTVFCFFGQTVLWLWFEGNIGQNVKAVFCRVSTGLTLVSVGFLHGWPLVSDVHVWCASACRWHRRVHIHCEASHPFCRRAAWLFLFSGPLPEGDFLYSCFSSLDMNHKLWHMQRRSTLLINSSINATDVWSVSQLEELTAYQILRQQQL